MRLARIVSGAVLVAACFAASATVAEPVRSGYLVRSGDVLLLYSEPADRDANSGRDCIQLLPERGALAVVPTQRVSVQGELKSTDDWEFDVRFIEAGGFQVQRERCGGHWMWASAITADTGE